jgi:probable phosphoglycerate mutase
MTRLLLVRHGQTEWNVTERFRGRADIPLDAAGLAQAERTADRIAGEWTPAAVYSSPLLRALATAKAIARPFSLQPQAEPGLIDIDYGKWQGRSPEEVRGGWPELLQAWYETPHRVKMPEGESLQDLKARGLKAVRAIGARHDGATVVLVGHTVINRVILLGVLGLGLGRFWNLRQDTCAINAVEMEGNRFVLVSMNDTCHLKRQSPTGIF